MLTEVASGSQEALPPHGFVFRSNLQPFFKPVPPCLAATLLVLGGCMVQTSTCFPRSPRLPYFFFWLLVSHFLSHAQTLFEAPILLRLLQPASSVLTERLGLCTLMCYCLGRLDCLPGEWVGCIAVRPLVTLSLIGVCGLFHTVNCIVCDHVDS